MERNPTIHKYFHKDDIVRNEDVWGDKLFVIHGFGGNWYCPELYVHPYGCEPTVGNSCIFLVRETKLIDADKRPLRKLDKKVLIKMMQKGVEEAKREFIFRSRK